ncbi:MAG: LmbE family protein [Muricauda sp.]|nr:PIG-L family deacetylase [Allomuricauda sp.]MBC30903.1 LmbE family protein [Allomuricauda sp.]|tara:strand:+ start:235 stop:2769 length:2535 start_codon:yes stop_codon:yes gene_type:complete
MLRFRVICFFVATFSLLVNAQKPEKPTSSEIFHELQKLNFLGTALYVAAHPDDENTRLISYLSNEVKARTAYLSITRGDGGQNLIGPELRELLGVLRTQELLAARRIDGGEQRFTRANDFGYSKHPDETLRIWDKEMVLGDLVKTIRQLKPDVIINRFDHRTPGRTHGHHTSSAMLSVEAFDLANDPNAYPQQLKKTEPWQPKRIFFNTSWWFYGSQENFQKADKSNMLNLDVGLYYPTLGVSNNEIASLASSQHLCQGFGRISTRGSQDEYIELIKGSLPADKTNLFDGIDTSWSRVKGGEAVGAILYEVEKNFDFKNPSVHVPDLIKAYTRLQKIEDDHWREVKSAQLKEIILACAGLYLETSATNATTYPGDSVTVNVEVLNRSDVGVTLEALSVSGTTSQLSPGILLAKNQKHNLTLKFKVPANEGYSSPYWLREPGTMGMYTVSEDSLIGKPETPEAFKTLFALNFGGNRLTFEKPIVYRYSKPDKGELYEPFAVLPKVTASFEEDVLIFSEAKPKTVSVTVRAGKENISGTIALDHPAGWSVSPPEATFELSQKGETRSIDFVVTPPSNDSEGTIKPKITAEGAVYDKELVEIAYDHIPKQYVLLPAKAKVVRLNILKTGEHIGYIVGAGDKVLESLEQIGYQVHTINLEDIGKEDLSRFDGIVVGIRAYNVVEDLKFKQPYLLDYVKNGGTLIVQYNTANRWSSQFENIAPYPLKISRDRVTDETAPVEILAKNHALVNFPNTIDEKDFDGWVQERGLYFPDEWGKEFTPILSMADKGETPKKGSLLVAPYGQGHYIYTGLSFFRELPAGVPGAFKLFANMLSIGKENLQSTDEIKG